MSQAGSLIYLRKADKMSLSYDISGVGGTAVAVNVEPITQGNLEWKTETPAKSGDGRTQTYSLNTSDLVAPLQVHVFSVTEKSGGILTRRFNITIESAILTTDSVDGRLYERDMPIKATLSMTVPLGAGVEVADLDKLLANLYSLTYPSVSSGTRNTGFMSKMLRGVTKLY